MNAVATIPREPSAPPPIADQIAPQIASAESVLANLQAQIGDRALRAALGEPGAQAALDALTQQIGTAERQVTQLRAALEIARQRDALAAAVARHRVRISTLKDFEGAVKTRLEAAKKLGAALAQASAAYRVFIETQNGLQMLLPLDVAMDHGELAVIRDLVPPRIVAMEMWRLGALPNSQGLFMPNLALPGAQPYALTNINPDEMPTLAERVAANSGWLLDTVRARVDELAPQQTQEAA